MVDKVNVCVDFEDLIDSCRKLVAASEMRDELWFLVSASEICDELWFMRLYNKNNNKAFDEYIIQKIKRIKDLCEKELENRKRDVD